MLAGTVTSTKAGEFDSRKRYRHDEKNQQEHVHEHLYGRPSAGAPSHASDWGAPGERRPYRAIHIDPIP